MKIIKKEVNKLNQDELSAIHKIEYNSNSTIFQELDFNIIVSRIFKSKLILLLAFQNKILIGFCCFHEKRIGILLNIYQSGLSQYSNPYGGWVYGLNSTNLTELLHKTFFINPLYSFHYLSAPFVEDKVFHEYQSSIFYTNTIDLSLSENEIFHTIISKNTRHNINRALKKGVSIESLNVTHINIIYNLIKELNTSQSKITFPIEYYSGIIEFYQSKNQCLILASKYKDKYLSCVLFLRNKYFTHAWIAGRIHELPKNIYQNEAIHWEAIKWAKHMNCQYFDFCYLYSQRQFEQQDIKQINIAQFKLGFSKQIISYYSLDRVGIIFKIISRLKKWFELFHL